MDGLAGYGSDSSSSSSASDGAAAAATKPAAAAAAAAPSLAALLPDASSSSEDEEEQEVKLATTSDKKQPSVQPNDGAGTIREADSPGSSSASSLKKKKRRRWDDSHSSQGDASVTAAGEANTYSAAVPSILPPPKLRSDGSGNAFDDLIRFDTDYTVQLRANLAAAAAAAATAATAESTTSGKNADQSSEAAQKQRREVEQTLNNFYNSFYGSGSSTSNGARRETDAESGRPASFASHLRHQHDFGNPNLFPSVIEHCGIDPRGSNLRWNDAATKFQDFEMVDRLVAAEEQARIRAAATTTAGRQ